MIGKITNVTKPQRSSKAMTVMKNLKKSKKWDLRGSKGTIFFKTKKMTRPLAGDLTLWRKIIFMTTPGPTTRRAFLSKSNK